MFSGGMSMHDIGKVKNIYVSDKVFTVYPLLLKHLSED